MRAFVLDPHVGAEMAQHPLGVIARRLGLGHHGFTRRREAGEQHGGFQLRRGGRRRIDDRDRVARALQRQRQPPAVADADRARAHPLQRIEHAPHRARAQRGIAIECRLDRTARHGPDDEPAPGAGIAEIERLCGLREARNADPLHRPGALPGAFDSRPQGTHRLAGVDDVLAFEQALDAGLTHRHGGQDERAVRDRLVARHAHASLQAGRAAGGERRHGLIHGMPLRRAASPTTRRRGSGRAFGRPKIGVLSLLTGTQREAKSSAVFKHAGNPAGG